MDMDAANRLSAIAAEMGQLQNEIQEHRRVLNFLLRNVNSILSICSLLSATIKIYTIYMILL
ncbi:hypothetical protein DCAR_0624767 [Daucus carota subsp. sativus]|uniref:Uncharacterized protein n=1 Tax=Daucus carota subsp. sativus TaxID=79200 RepID=A0AAF0XBS8_DAUCS|nr:hypothetical protein DCAR_0624767 [Daucus carota subsp. sativus]